MATRKALPVFPTPPEDYDPAFMRKLVRQLQLMEKQLVTPGEGRNTFHVYTDLQSGNDRNLELGTIFEIDGVVHVAVRDRAYLEGVSASLSTGELLVNVNDIGVTLTGSSMTLSDGTVIGSGGDDVSVALTGGVMTSAIGTVTGTGDAVWTPIALYAGGENGFWLDASEASSLWSDDGVTQATTNGTAIYRWDDQSGNANHAYQVVVASRPTLDTGSYSTNSVHFDQGIYQFMDLPDDFGCGGSTNRSFFFVTGAMSNLGYLIGQNAEDSSAGAVFRVRTDGDTTNNEIQIELSGGVSSQVPFGTDPTGGKAIYGMTFSGTTLADATLYVGTIGTAATGTTVINTTNSGNMLGGARGDGITGGIFEVVAVDRSLTSAERTQLVSYWTTKYGL